MTNPTDSILAYFEELNAIPRCSKNEAAVCKWLETWASERQHDHVKDAGGNLVVRIPASAGYEDAPPVVLQGHMDMVCEKTPDSRHDFDTDPILSHMEGDWLTATDTTLGADNGIAIAYMLALVDDSEIAHPPLELLFTVDEETGLNGAKMLEPGFIHGRCLINLDSEDEGIFTIGCAGGVDTTMSLTMETRDLPADTHLIRLVVGGLKGGHSGIDIHKQRGNANKILARTLEQIEGITPIRLVSINGGSRKNAIPRDARADVWIEGSGGHRVQEVVEEMALTIRSEFSLSDKSLYIEMVDPSGTNSAQNALTRKASTQLIRFLLGLPNGVSHMSAELDGMVETSCNLATVSLDNGRLVVLSSQRSAASSRLNEITAEVHAVAGLAGATAQDHDTYPPWQPQMNSLLLSRSKKTYRMLYGQEPVIQVIHAGLECAVIGDIYSGMDMISFGPTIRDPHSPDERIWIPSIIKVWDFLTALLKGMKN